jgi:hypothetical protein
VKEGKNNIQEFASELMRQQEAKRDFIAPTDKMKMCVEYVHPMDGDPDPEQVAGVNLAVGTTFEGKINSTAHNQLATRLEIPQKYYDKCLVNDPNLLATNVNRWLCHKSERRMVRTMDGRVRAVLSDRYRVRDNFQLGNYILPELDKEGLVVESCEVTERKMYIKAVFPGRKHQHTFPGFYGGAGHDKIETYFPGCIISNSEIGYGSTYVGPGLVTRECSNLATFGTDAIKKFHLGGRIKNGDDETVFEYMSDEAREAEDKAFFLVVRDMIRACLEGALFDKFVGMTVEAQGDEIKKPNDVVELAGKQFLLTGDETQGVLAELANGSNMTRLGLSQAITRFSQQVECYDRASELERIGGKVVELNQNEWGTLVG